MSKLSNLIHINKSFLPSFTQEDIEELFASLHEQFMRNLYRLNKGAEVYLTDWDSKKSKVPAINIIEKRDSFAIEAEMPGLELKDISVDVSNQLLTIKGKKETAKEEQQEGAYLRQELYSNYMQRTISLPETACGDKAEASFRNGLLTISVPKKAAAIQEPKRLTIRNAA